MPQITLAELVRNGTMNAEMAGVLWAAVDSQTSFLTVALPRLAGKTTTSNAVLALRPPGVPAYLVDGQAQAMEQLKRERRGGYLVVAEFANAPMPGYIWGAPVRRVFDCAIEGGYALQTSLHANSAENGMLEVTRGNQVPDEHASLFKLVIYIERFGTSMANYTRRVVDLYEVLEVREGRPIGQSLYTWNADGDRFERRGEASHIGASQAEVSSRGEVIQELAESGQTSQEAVQAAVDRFRSTRA